MVCHQCEIFHDKKESFFDWNICYIFCSCRVFLLNESLYVSLRHFSEWIFSCRSCTYMQGYLYQKVRHFFESAQSYQNHVFSWFYALLMILFCFFGFRCVLSTKLTKILHFRVSVAKIFQFGYFDTILAKKRILAYRGYKGHFLAWIGGQLPPKLRSLNKRLNFP